MRGLWGWLVFFCAQPALAHGRPPAVTHIDISGPMVAVQTTFGLYVGGVDAEPRTWRWSCLEAAGVTGEQSTRPFLVGERVAVPSFLGLTVGEADNCRFRWASRALGNTVVADGVRSGSPNAAYVVSASPREANGVYRTLDAGQTWALTGESIARDRFTSIRVAGASGAGPARMYLAGRPPLGERGPGSVYRSEDGGQTWRTMPAPEREPGDADPAELWLLGVDPKDADHVLARVIGVPERVIASRDGGQTWSTRLTLGSAEAFAWHADGNVAYLSGAQAGGLYRSADGGRSFALVNGSRARPCLALAGELLFACGGAEQPTAVLRSADRGATWSTVADFEALPPPTLDCPAGSTVRERCPAQLEDVIRDLRQLRAARAGGCASGPSPPTPPGAWLAAVGLLAMRPLRRSRTPLVRTSLDLPTSLDRPNRPAQLGRRDHPRRRAHP